MPSRVRPALGSAAFFVVAPGVVAGAVPWWLTGWRAQGPPRLLVVVGALLAASGVAVLLATFRQFVREGRGTPAPVAPTAQLVVGGLYRYVRNPMYVGVVATILGQALVLGAEILAIYAGVVWATVAGFVRWYEEPTLVRQFGAAYAAYREAVPAWWPRIRPWTPVPPSAPEAVATREEGGGPVGPPPSSG